MDGVFLQQMVVIPVLICLWQKDQSKKLRQSSAWFFEYYKFYCNFDWFNTGYGKYIFIIANSEL